MLRAEWRSRRIERIETLFFERAIVEVDGPEGDGRDADGKELDPPAFLDSPRLRTLMRYMGAQRSELHRAHDAILRQRHACERTERHDKAMKEDHVCRGFYYGPAGRYPNHDPDWYPLSAESDTPPPFAEPPGEPPSACKNEPEPPPDPLSDCRNEPEPANDDAPASPESLSAEPAKPSARPDLRVVPNEPEPVALDLSPRRAGEPDLPPPILALWRDPARLGMHPDEVERLFAAAWQAWDADIETSAAWEARRAAGAGR
jgi:hypothetical protein